MRLILKRGTEYTPIAFQNENLLNKKYCDLGEENNYTSRIITENSFKLDKCLNTERIFNDRVSFSRQQFYYNEFTGGLVRRNAYNSVIALIVTKNNTTDKYVIVDKHFSENYATYFSRIKRSMKALGIPTKTKLLLWTSDEISSEFVETFSPTVEDYDPEIQKQLSNEFISSQIAELVELETIDHPF